MRFIPLLSVFTASFAVVNLAGARDVQSTLQRKYDSLGKAFVQKDLSIFAKALTSGYVLVGTNGHSLARKTVLADYGHQMESMAESTWQRSAGKPVVHGYTAVVTVKSKLKGTVILQGKKHAFETNSTMKDTWVRKGSDWLLSKTLVLSLDATLDGRPLKHA